MTSLRDHLHSFAATDGDERSYRGYTMRYLTADLGERKPRHIIQTFDGGRVVGELNWYGTTGTIHNVDVDQAYSRQGIATAMWEWGQEMRPKPKHSGDRTTQGDAWARSVGGPIPRKRSASSSDIRVEETDLGVVAFVGDQPAGAMALWPDGTIELLKVEPQFRRRGVARALYEKATDVVGHPPLPSGVLSPDGAAFMTSMTGREFEATGHQQMPSDWVARMCRHAKTASAISYRVEIASDGGFVEATSGGLRVGFLEWSFPKLDSWEGRAAIADVKVHESYRRQGIATEMLTRARAAVDYSIEHSSSRTPDGDAWAEKTASLKVRFQEGGKYGRRDHITMEETGTVPIEVVRSMPGLNGEVPGDHRNKKGEVWEEFKRDLTENGMKQGIFICITPGEPIRIWEGSHRRDAAVELGWSEVPVQVRYFGLAEQDGTLMERFVKGGSWMDGSVDRSRLARHTASVPGLEMTIIQLHDDMMRVTALINGRAVGQLDWQTVVDFRKPSGVSLGIIDWVTVVPAHRLKGIAKEMLDFARSSVDYPIKHSNMLTEDGAAWKARVGTIRPRYVPYCFECAREMGFDRRHEIIPSRVAEDQCRSCDRLTQCGYFRIGFDRKEGAKSSPADQIREQLRGADLPVVARDGDCLPYSGKVVSVLKEHGWNAHVVYVTGFTSFMDQKVVGWMHVAVAVTEGGSTLIVDATATQFDQSVRSLIIESPAAYKRIMLNATGVEEVEIEAPRGDKLGASSTTWSRTASSGDAKYRKAVEDYLASAKAEGKSDFGSTAEAQSYVDRLLPPGVKARVTVTHKDPSGNLALGTKAWVFLKGSEWQLSIRPEHATKESALHEVAHIWDVEENGWPKQGRPGIDLEQSWAHGPSFRAALQKLRSHHSASSWRALVADAYWDTYDVTISSDGGPSGRKAYEIHVGGKPFANRPSLTEAKAVVEAEYGPQQWRTVRSDKMVATHYHLGDTTEFTAPTTIWVADF